ncbi:peptidase S8/S53 domain-containing protein [Radiomyces spectabilis]|uniref:peptidase S8/S53 domain-containing protein n=1 Tax=Radiomyces spectabilis TaxID=64574 RepID=UPI00221E4D22|nr:peptidase S8/S53 domain-containing protein [Radiomyces spectabilis]KAI8393906.1 peptidase S8/S53 domain-containing protein [Radiomyces spectabilis]
MLRIWALFFFLQLVASSSLSSSSNHTNAPQRFTIQFSSSPDNITAVKEEQDAFINYMHEIGVNFTVRYRFQNVINAMSIVIMPATTTITSNSTSAPITPNPYDFKPSMFLSHSRERLPFVHRYWAGKKYSRPRTIKADSLTYNGKANLDIAHSMTGVATMKNKGWYGKGIKIGILDTGVDYMHPALGGCFGPGCLIEQGYDLVGDDYGNSDVAQPDDDPRDVCDGHGSHVAGILAANDTIQQFEGVAPRSKLGVWRIFGCDGETDDDIILEAAERAVVAGMNIINLSLGGGESAWEEDALAVALSNIVDRGVMVVVAQGNEGRDGIARTPSPSIGHHIISVASVDINERWVRRFHVVHNGSAVDTLNYSVGGNKLLRFPVGPNVGITLVKETACRPLLRSLRGLIASVEEGLCSASVKARNIQAAGAEGIIFLHSSESKKKYAKLEASPQIHIPVITLNTGSSLSLLHALQHNVSLKARFDEEKVHIKTAGQPSLFSTFGPDAELHLKPDIAAVGGYIYSTYPLSMGGYTTMSGTSMATPYLAGCLALYMEATKQHDPRRITAAILNHARPINGRKHNHTETPIRQGAGLVQLYDSVQSRSLILPAKLALNDTRHFRNNRTLLIENQSIYPQLYRLSHIPTMGVYGYDFKESSVPLESPHYKAANATVKFEKNTFFLGGRQKATVQIQFEQPNITDLPHFLYGGFVKIHVFGRNHTRDVIHIPYFGSTGNQFNLPLFDTMQGYPYIGGPKGTRLTRKRLMYDFSRGDLVHIFSRLGSPTAQVKAELLDQHRRPLGELLHTKEVWVPRNDHSEENYEFTYHWDGRYAPYENQNIRQHIHGGQIIQRASKGIYYIKLYALKIFGDPTNPNDWETWQSPRVFVKS